MTRLICLIVLIFMAAACAREPVIVRPATISADTVLISLEPFQFPEFNDDLLWDGLSYSMDQSLGYLRRIPEDTTFRFGPDVFTRDHMIASLERFRELIDSRPEPGALKRHLASEFRVYRSIGRTDGDMLFTGYYEPFLRGSKTKSTRYPYPVYGKPADLLTIDLEAFSSRFEAEQLRGRLVGRAVVPYHDRQAIDRDRALSGKADIIAWVDDPIDLFFLHIQGSGKLYLDTGEALNIHYHTTNGRPYRSVGKILIDRGEIPKEEMSMQAIRRWMEANPGSAEALMDENPSYVFFKTEDIGPLGAINALLTPGRSIATDRRLFPKGALAFIRTEKPLVDGANQIQEWVGFGRFVLNQDTGGAIRGPGRADLFWGNGPYAEIAAGHMQQPGEMYFLVMKPPS